MFVRSREMLFLIEALAAVLGFMSIIENYEYKMPTCAVKVLMK